jgi:hypothetical protein
MHEPGVATAYAKIQRVLAARPLSFSVSHRLPTGGSFYFRRAVSLTTVIPTTIGESGTGICFVALGQDGGGYVGNKRGLKPLERIFSSRPIPLLRNARRFGMALPISPRGVGAPSQVPGPDPAPPDHAGASPRRRRTGVRTYVTGPIHIRNMRFDRQLLCQLSYAGVVSEG